jgi:hypothetical protein
LRICNWNSSWRCSKFATFAFRWRTCQHYFVAIQFQRIQFCSNSNSKNSILLQFNFKENNSVIILKFKSILLSVLLRLIASDYPFGILWPLCCLSFCDWQLLITHLVSFGHCVVCPRTDNTMAKDTKWVIRSCQSQKDKQHNGHKIPNG